MRALHMGAKQHLFDVTATLVHATNPRPHTYLSLQRLREKSTPENSRGERPTAQAAA